LKCGGIMEDASKKKKFLEDYNLILNTDCGALFYMADLHIHTPASFDFSKNVSDIKDILKAAKDKGIEICAITDHNTEENCKNLIDLGEKFNLMVFPGVEVTSGDGKKNIHLNVLFDPSDFQKVDDFLTKIDIFKQTGGKRISSDEVFTQKSILDILDLVENFGGIAIGAHAEAKNGIIGGLSGQQRIKIVQNNALMAVENINERNRTFFDGTDRNYQRKIAIIYSSDAHIIDDIGEKYTLIKMGEKNLEGLRQAFLDPDSRIRYEKDLFNYPKIIGLKIEGGFLDGEIINFNNNFNCIIGGRGTGKSTILEFLRYVLNDFPKKSDVRTRMESLIEHTLGEGKITTYLELEDNVILKVVRSWDSPVKIFGEDGEQKDIEIERLFKIEAYSQEEIIEVSKDPQIQLEIFDNFIEAKENLEKIKEIKRDLSEYTTKILDKEDHISDLENETAQLEIIKEKLKKYRLIKPDLEKQKKWNMEHQKINNLLKYYRDQQDKFTDITKIDLVNELPPIKDSENKDAFLKLKKELKEFENIINSYLFEINENFSKFGIKLNQFIDEWNIQYEKQSERNKEVLIKLQKEGFDKPSQYLKLEQQKEHLIEKLDIINKEKNALKNLMNKRRELLRQLEVEYKTLYEKRIDGSSKINQETDGKLRVSIQKSANKKKLDDFLKDILKGQKVNIFTRSQLVEQITKDELLEYIKNGDYHGLKNKAKISENTAHKIINNFKTNKNLYDLENLFVDDRIIIELQLDSGNYRKIERLSPGQKCTVILLMILLQKNIPLLIDQPEDNLDNSFIHSFVIDKIRNVKDKRQIILATHNANIPVLGDAELIIALQAERNKGNILAKGAIDKQNVKESVISILEGGNQAFWLRKQKYGF